MILGLPTITFLVFCIPIVGMIFSIILMIRGWYEGKSVEEEYGVEEWYHSW